MLATMKHNHSRLKACNLPPDALQIMRSFYVSISNHNDGIHPEPGLGWICICIAHSNQERV